MPEAGAPKFSYVGCGWAACNQGSSTATVTEVGADALNLRVQLPGMSPGQVREQIGRIGSTVIPSLKKIWPAPEQAP